MNPGLPKIYIAPFSLQEAMLALLQDSLCLSTQAVSPQTNYKACKLSTQAERAFFDLVGSAFAGSDDGTGTVSDFASKGEC